VRFLERVGRQYGAGSVLADRDYGGGETVRVVSPEAVGRGTDPADLVVSFDAPSRTARWHEYALSLAGLARKVLVVLVTNPERTWSRRAGDRAVVELAGVLWRAGRVRERTYLGLPSLLSSREYDARSFPAPFVVRRTARVQAFVVDTAPRTPQARLRLRAGGTTSGSR
jgi:hypothetical protein